MKIATLTLVDLAAMKRLGLFLAKELMVGDVLALQGALGAGKSELARAIIQQVCPDETDIPSPTFTLVQAYESDDNGSLLHFDLYRLAEPDDVFELGIEDAFVEAVCLIEWPERLAGYLPDYALTIKIDYDPGTNRDREVTLIGDAVWQKRLKGILPDHMD